MAHLPSNTSEVYRHRSKSMYPLQFISANDFQLFILNVAAIGFGIYLGHVF